MKAPREYSQPDDARDETAQDATDARVSKSGATSPSSDDSDSAFDGAPQNPNAPDANAIDAKNPATPFPKTGRDRARELLRSEFRARDWRAIQWLTPGLGLKRWALLCLCGLAFAAAGTSLATAYVSVDAGLLLSNFASPFGFLIDPVALGIALLALGIIAVAVGLRGVIKAVERAFAVSRGSGDFLELALRRRKMEQGERVVALGGGTGLSTMLRGLKAYSSNVTAVVTMADDGGSSGMLREEGMLPPGDLRNCMAALADAEPQMQELFQHRFEGLGALRGHSLGNLIVAAMCEITGDFESAVRETSRVLAIRGSVLPSTLDDIRLGADLEDGSQVVGQSVINKTRGIRRAYLIPEHPKALPGVVKAIENAELIIIGPGSLFTSIIPNLLVPEIAAAIRANTRAPKIYVCNVMTQPGETSGFKASDHVRAIIRHIGPGIVTHALINTGRVDARVLARYQESGAEYVEPDENAIAMLGVQPRHGNFIDATNLVRHNPPKLADAIFKIAAKTARGEN